MVRHENLAKCYAFYYLQRNRSSSIHPNLIQINLRNQQQMKYAEKERRMYYDFAFMAVLLVVLIAFIATDYIYLLERYIYVAMLAPYVIGRWVSDKFIYKTEERCEEDELKTESAS